VLSLPQAGSLCYAQGEAPKVYSEDAKTFVQGRIIEIKGLASVEDVALTASEVVNANATQATLAVSRGHHR